MKRVRATAVVALCWSAAWTLAGAALVAWRAAHGYTSLAASLPAWPHFVRTGLAFFAYAGLTSGATFGIVLSSDQSRLFTFPTRRAAARVGALSSLPATVALPFLGLTSVVPLLFVAALAALLGAGTALAIVSVALGRDRRRATDARSATTG